MSWEAHFSYLMARRLGALTEKKLKLCFISVNLLPLASLVSCKSEFYENLEMGVVFFYFYPNYLSRILWRFRVPTVVDGMLGSL